MAQSRKNITPENITEWLASSGFLFPRNKIELARFEKIFGDEDLGLIGNEIDPDKILNGLKSTIKSISPEISQNELNEYRMVARNGNALPKHILEKIKQNQENSKMNDIPTQEE